MAAVNTDTTLSNAGQGTIEYNITNGTLTRVMPDGRRWDVGTGEGQRYSDLYSEYVKQQQANGGRVLSGGTDISSYGQGQLSYNDKTGAYTRTLNGINYYVPTGAYAYDQIAKEYNDLYGNPAKEKNPVTMYQTDTSAANTGMMNSANNMANATYTPVDVRAEAAKHMSFDEAYELARRIIEPQYVQKYNDAANAAAQRMASAGLYDSGMGQGFMMNAQNQVTQDMNAQLGVLAQQLMETDYDKAIQIAKMLQDENQYGADYYYKNQNAAGNLYNDYMNTMLTGDKNVNNFNLENYELGQRDKEIANEQAYREAQMEQMALENAYTQAKTEYQNLANQMAQAELAGYGAAGSSGGYSGDGDGYYYIGDNIGDGTPIANNDGYNGLGQILSEIKKVAALKSKAKTVKEKEQVYQQQNWVDTLIDKSNLTDAQLAYLDAFASSVGAY